MSDNILEIFNHLKHYLSRIVIRSTEEWEGPLFCRRGVNHSNPRPLTPGFVFVFLIFVKHLWTSFLCINCSIVVIYLSLAAVLEVFVSLSRRYLPIRCICFLYFVVLDDFFFCKFCCHATHRGDPTDSVQGEIIGEMIMVKCSGLFTSLNRHSCLIKNQNWDINCKFTLVIFLMLMTVVMIGLNSEWLCLIDGTPS